MDNSVNIKDRMKAADFALWETVLYLDAYPNDKEALANFYKLLVRYNYACANFPEFFFVFCKD